MAVPKHIAFIMDGNRRFAKAQNESSAYGHTKGREKAEEVIEWCIAAGIEHITLWALSTENWKKRSVIEQTVFFKLIDEIPTCFEKMQKYHVSLDFIGDIASMPLSVQKSVRTASEKIHSSTPKHFIHIGINYGGREELLHAIEEIRTLPDDLPISSDTVHEHLYTHHIPDVELVIRTGGQKRLSGFMLWQCEYAELYFSQTMWPAYSHEEFSTHLLEYADTQKNFGA